MRSKHEVIFSYIIKYGDVMMSMPGKRVSCIQQQFRCHLSHNKRSQNVFEQKIGKHSVIFVPYINSFTLGISL